MRNIHRSISFVSTHCYEDHTICTVFSCILTAAIASVVWVIEIILCVMFFFFLFKFSEWLKRMSPIIHPLHVWHMTPHRYDMIVFQRIKRILLQKSKRKNNKWALIPPTLIIPRATVLFIYRINLFHTSPELSVVIWLRLFVGTHLPIIHIISIYFTHFQNCQSLYDHAYSSEQFAQQ